MLQKLQAIINKDDFDFGRKDIKMLEFHSILKFMLKLAGLVYNEKIVWWSWLFLLFVLATGSFGIFELISTGYIVMGESKIDIPLMTEVGAYMIILMLQCASPYVFLTDKKNYHKFQDICENDFRYIAGEGIRYRNKYFANQLVTWKATIASLTFVVVTVLASMAYATFIPIYYILSEDTGEKKLVFPIKSLFLDTQATPYYEIYTVIQYFFLIGFSASYAAFFIPMIAWIGQVMTKADIVIWMVQDLMEGIQPTARLEQKKLNITILEERIAVITKQHQSMIVLFDLFADVHKKFLMFQQACSGPVVCLTAYAFAEKMDNGEMQVMLATLSVATAIQYLIPCYACTLLTLKLRSVSDECAEVKYWWGGGGDRLRIPLLLIMQRSLRPFRLHGTGFKEVSLHTYSQNMTSAYSYFNMLRQI